MSTRVNYIQNKKTKKKNIIELKIYRRKVIINTHKFLGGISFRQLVFAFRHTVAVEEVVVVAATVAVAAVAEVVAAELESETQPVATARFHCCYSGVLNFVPA